MSRAATALLLLACVPACQTIGVREARRGDPLDCRGGKLCCATLSPRTLQTLRLYDLDHAYDRDPADALRRLHAEAVATPSPDALFALTEVSYRLGRSAEKKDPRSATRHFAHTCAYAQHFLRASCDERPADATGCEPTLTPRDAFDPRFRIACDLYNAGLARCLRSAQKDGRLDAQGTLTLPGDGEADEPLPVVHSGFPWTPEQFGPLRFCEDYAVVGLANEYHTYGLGVPLIGTTAGSAADPRSYFAPGLNFPVTALLRCEGGLGDFGKPGSMRLELYNPRAAQSVSLAGHSVPLEADLTTPLAHFLGQSSLDMLAYKAFLRPDRLKTGQGIRMLEPYQPGKIPVLLVHGLLSSPATWAPLYNDLQADPALRNRYQFWVYFYPTSEPYLATAADLRLRLELLRTDLDPKRTDAAFDKMVLVGHSMGGLVSHLMTVEGGDDFWKLASDAPLSAVKAKKETRDWLEGTFYFHRRTEVARVVFLGTPHHGSKLSPTPLAREATKLVRLPKFLMDSATDLTGENPGVSVRSLPTSVDMLAPHAPALEILASRPKPAGVKYHSVIGVAPKDVAVVERWLSGDTEPGDGVVPVASARLEGVDSELVVPASHYEVHQHPLAVREVRRILTEHAAGR